MVRIAFVIGDYPPAERKKREDAAKAYESEEVQIGFISVAASPYGRLNSASVEAVQPQFHDAFVQAQKEGYDAVVPLGMVDLGIEGGRCLVDIPVMPPLQSALHIASFLGDRIGMVTYEKYGTPRLRYRLRGYGYEHKVCGIRNSGMPKSEFTANRDKLVETFLREARVLIEENEADVIIAAGVSLCPVQIKPDFLAKELGVPVVEGIGGPIRLAAMFAHLGLSHSRLRFPKSESAA